MFNKFLTEEDKLVNIIMLKNFDIIIGVFLNEEEEDEEEVKKEAPVWEFKIAKLLAPILTIEEKLRSDWRNQLYFFKQFIFIVSIFQDNEVEKKLFPILEINLKNGNRQ